MAERVKTIRNGEMSLVDLKSNESARIIKIGTNDMTKLRKMMAFGIMPGVEVTMIQKYPALVIQIGYTQVALDEAIASEVLIHRRTRGEP
jgi:ferrous iron transport protein A